MTARSRASWCADCDRRRSSRASLQGNVPGVALATSKMDRCTVRWPRRHDPAAGRRDPRVRQSRRRPAPPFASPSNPWTLLVGLSDSARDRDHYAVSGFYGRFPLFALDRASGSDRLGTSASRSGPIRIGDLACVRPGPDADPETAGKYNFWEAAGLSYLAAFRPLPSRGRRSPRLHQSPPSACSAPGRMRPRQPDGSPRARTSRSRSETLDTILFPSFRGRDGRGDLRGRGGHGQVRRHPRGIPARLNSSGSRINAPVDGVSD